MIPRFALSLVALVLFVSDAATAQGIVRGGKRQSISPGLERPSGLDLPLDLVSQGEEQTSLNQMGTALEVVGNYLFVSAPGDGDGRVDIWYRGPNGYLLIQQLFVPASIAGDNQFGKSLAADGGVLVVGTRTGNNAGRAVVHRRAPNGLYYYESVVAPSNGNVGFSGFADRLAVLEDELLAVSSRGELAVHVFEADGNGRFPSLSTRILNPVNTGTTPSLSWMTSFGSTVGLHRAPSGLVSVLIGMQDACFYQRTQMQAPDEVTPDPFGATAARTGGIAVVRKAGSSWLLQQRLIPEYSKTKDFGFEVEVEGSHEAVGAIYSNVFSNGFNAGTASAYRWNGSTFELVSTVWPSTPSQNSLFGYCLEIRDGHLLVGQPQHWGGPQGLVEVFRITNDDLVAVDLITAPDGNGAQNQSSLGDSFGRAITSNDRGEVLIGAPFSAPNMGSTPQYAGGALYLYQ